MTHANFIINHALICDDYRVEGNGKGLVIGLYANSMLFDKLPTNVGFCICLIGSVKQSFSVEIRIKFMPADNSDPVVSKTTVSGEMKDLGREDSVGLFIPWRHPAMVIKCEGKLLVSVRPEGGKRWKTITRMDIGIKP